MAWKRRISAFEAVGKRLGLLQRDPVFAFLRKTTFRVEPMLGSGPPLPVASDRAFASRKASEFLRAANPFL
jgi:hypothetical protein